LFASEHYGIEPDILVTAKSLGGGLPLAAVTGRAEIMDAPGPGGLGGTFAGNPLSCAAALAVFDLFEKENLLSARERIRQSLPAPRPRMAKRAGLSSATSAASAACKRSNWSSRRKQKLPPRTKPNKSRNIATSTA
jgi:acetylornithine/succinyldiaminopimelate/putrescine aminotransferase